MSGIWIGPKREMRGDVVQIYEKYKDRIPLGTLPMLSPPGGEEKFYVYEWFTKDTGKVFYVGKGSDRRYRHILSDMKHPRGKWYKELQDSFGIDYRFLVKDLTSREAEIYEICMMIERTDQGEVLLQSANNPGFESWPSLDTMRKTCSSRKFTPEVVVNPYYCRYFGIDPPDYDPVDLSRLRVAFRSSCAQISLAPDVLQEMDQLREIIVRAGGRVYATVAKTVQAIVEFDIMDYERFMEYKHKGLLVYHAFDVARCLVEQNGIPK